MILWEQEKNLIINQINYELIKAKNFIIFFSKIVRQ